MRFATGLLLSMLVLSGAVCAQSPKAPTLEYYKTMDWISTNQVHSETFDVAAGNWLEIKVACHNGPYVQSCGQPEYFVNGDRVKVPRVGSWTVNGSTAQVFGMPVSTTGTITVYIPVLFGGIEYKGAILVSDGPG